MNKTILQVPLSRELRDNAEKAALAEGFSSLQEIVRVFLSKLAQKKVEVALQEPIYLSKKAEKRYEKITQDFVNDKNIISFSSVDDLMKDLRS